MSGDVGRMMERNEQLRALRPENHGHVLDHAPFFDGLIADCPGCQDFIWPDDDASRSTP